MAIHGEKGFARAIHNIENSPFRTKFEKDIEEFDGNLGIGCISDNEAQPLLVKSHLAPLPSQRLAVSTIWKSCRVYALNAGLHTFWR